MEDYNVEINDFYKIAELDDPTWNYNKCYYYQLMKFIPDNAETCLKSAVVKENFYLRFQVI